MDIFPPVCNVAENLTQTDASEKSAFQNWESQHSPTYPDSHALHITWQFFVENKTTGAKMSIETLSDEVKVVFVKNFECEEWKKSMPVELFDALTLSGFQCEDVLSVVPAIESASTF